MFGSQLGLHETREAAQRQLLDEGLGALSERWTLLHVESGEEETVCILHANPTTVTVARGYYSLPGVPTLTITGRQIAEGEWVLRREVSTGIRTGQVACVVGEESGDFPQSRGKFSAMAGGGSAADPGGEAAPSDRLTTCPPTEVS